MLLRRAIIERDEHSWSALVTAYDAEVRRWCRRAGTMWGLDLDEAVCLTWEKFWLYFSPEKLDRANGIAQVMQYLQMCAHSVVLDARRLQAAHAQREILDPELPDRSPTVSEMCAEREGRRELWQAITAQLRGEEECVLVSLHYEAGLTSAQVQAARPDLFPDINKVYTVTSRVLSRLKRNPSLRRWRAERAS